jgi:hypothetical protein
MEEMTAAMVKAAVVVEMTAVMMAKTVEALGNSGGSGRDSGSSIAERMLVHK